MILLPDTDLAEDLKDLHAARQKHGGCFVYFRAVSKEDRNRHIVIQYKSGVSIVKIAEDEGLTTRQIRNIVKVIVQTPTVK